MRSVARNSVFLLSSQAASILIRFAYLFILVRALSPSTYGALNYALSWYLVLLPMTYLGSDVILGREVTRNRQNAPRLLGATLGLRICAVLLVMLASIAAVGAAENDPQVRSVIVIFSFTLIGRGLWMWSGSVFTAFEQAHLLLRFELLSRLIEIAVLIALLETYGPDLRAIAIVHASSWFLQAVGSIASIWRRYGISFHWPKRDWGAVLRDGIPGAIFAVALGAFFQLPVMLFRHVVGIGDALGNFALGFQIVTYLLTIPYVVSQAALPVLSRNMAIDIHKTRKVVTILAAPILLGGAAVALTGSLVTGLFIVALFGPAYASAAAVLGWGLWLLIPASLAMLVQQMLFTTSKRSIAAALAPVAGVACMCLVFPQFVRAEGAQGALWAISWGLVVWLVCALVGARERLLHTGRSCKTSSEVGGVSSIGEPNP